MFAQPGTRGTGTAGPSGRRAAPRASPRSNTPARCAAAADLQPTPHHHHPSAGLCCTPKKLFASLLALGSAAVLTYYAGPFARLLSYCGLGVFTGASGLLVSVLLLIKAPKLLK